MGKHVVSDVGGDPSAVLDDWEATKERESAKGCDGAGKTSSRRFLTLASLISRVERRDSQLEVMGGAEREKRTTH
jgi:hypothetical protein